MVPAGTPVVAAVGNTPFGGEGAVVVVVDVVVVVVGAAVVVVGAAVVVVGAAVVVGAGCVVVVVVVGDGAQVTVTPLRSCSTG